MEPQLLAYATATATPDPSHLCDLHHSSWQHQILDSLSEARDRTCNLMVPSRVRFHCATTGSPPMFFLQVFSSSHSGSEEFFDPTADASCMNTYTKRDHVFAKLNLQLQRGTVTLLHQEQGAPQTNQSAFMQLEFSGTAPKSYLCSLSPGYQCPPESYCLR